MITAWKKFRTLFYGLEKRRKVPHHPAHLLYGILTLFSILAALVMHGSVRYTLTVAALVIPASLVVFVPYRYLNILSRMLLNALIFGAGCFWMMHNIEKSPHLDKLLIETLSLWSLCFLVSGNSRGYFYLLFIDILLLLYAALLPRLLSLYLTAGAVILMILLLFANRAGYLSGDMMLKNPARTFRRNWHLHLLQLMMSSLIFYCVFSVMPLTDNTFSGMVTVSFRTERESFVPPELQSWLQTGKNVKNSPDGRDVSDDAKGDALSLTRKAEGKLISLPRTPPNLPVAPGDGGSAMGSDLLFRVRMPLKLYHLSRIYDRYSGREWHCSRAMYRNKLRSLPEEQAKRLQRIKSSYYVEKLFSPHLAAPWHLQEMSAAENTKASVQHHFWGAELKKYDSLPLRFNAVSELTLPRFDRDFRTIIPPLWPERIPVRHYLQLPKNRISKRVQLLAKSIISGHASSYSQAVALRDFLRKNYTYKLEAAKTPRHLEPVDYFLFYLGEGHCEYFASALAVMARCAGLPSRVALGFSPGNYNTLTSQFEVYEYHAHAWTQIYIKEYGWLTFDATPPSAVVSRTTPAGFGSMRDPFGDEWRVRPPELTDRTLEHLDRIQRQNEAENSEKSELSRTLSDITEAGEKLRQELAKEHKNTRHKVLPSPVKRGIFDMHDIRKAIIESFKKIQIALIDFALFITASWWRLLLAAAVLLLAGAAGTIIFLTLKKLCKKIKLLWFFRCSAGKVPQKSIRFCCRGALLMLELYGFPRSGNMELVEYASSLRSDLTPDAEKLFRIYYRSEFRSGTPDKADADEALKALYSLRTSLLNKPKRSDAAG